MIDRYSRSEMKEIWSDRNRFVHWLEVELAVCEEMVKVKALSKKDFSELQKKCRDVIASGGLDPKEIEDEEKITRHDVIAFTTVLARKIGPLSRYIHFGLTSSDVIDTALALQVKKASELIENDVESLIEVLHARASEFKKLPTIGRSHGIFAEPTSFGLKFLGWAQEWKRNSRRLKTAFEGLRVGKLSGAVGVNSHWSPWKKHKF